MFNNISKYIPSISFWGTPQTPQTSQTSSRNETPVVNANPNTNANTNSNEEFPKKYLGARPDLNGRKLSPEEIANPVLSSFIFHGKVKPEDIKEVGCFCLKDTKGDLRDAFYWLILRMPVDTNKGIIRIIMDFSDCQLDDALCEKLAGWLKILPGKFSLNLKNNQIGDKGAQAIAQWLNPCLQPVLPDSIINLDLNTSLVHWKDIGSGHGVMEEIKTLRMPYQNLVFLDLEGNRISDKGVQTICAALEFNETLIRANLRNNPTGPMKESLRFCIEVCMEKNLQNILSRLDVSMAHEPDGKIAVDLSDCELNDEHCEAVVNIVSEWIKKFPEEKIILVLSYNRIGDEGAKSIAQLLASNLQITDLNLGENQIGSEGINEICKVLLSNEVLTSLYLFGNNFGAEGCEGIADMLLMNKTLSILDIDNNFIGDDGIKVISIALKFNASLTALYIQKNNIGSHGAQEIGKALKNNLALTALHLQENAIGLEGLGAISDTLGLNLNSNLNPNLKLLNLRSSKIGDDGAQIIGEMLKKNTSLTTLNLTGNKITNQGVKAISEGLQPNQTLGKLILRQNSISSQGIVMLRNQRWKMSPENSFQKLVFIKMQPVLTHEKLLNLGIDETIPTTPEDIQKAAIRYIKEEKKPEKLAWLVTHIPRKHNMPPIVNLTGCNLIARDFDTIAMWLEISPEQVILNLNKNNIGDEVADKIGLLLQYPQITQLYLGGNHFGNVGMGIIGKALKFNRSLTKLYLLNNDIDNLGAECLVADLARTQTVTDLNLSGNPIDKLGAAAIREMGWLQPDPEYPLMFKKEVKKEVKEEVKNKE